MFVLTFLGCQLGGSTVLAGNADISRVSWLLGDIGWLHLGGQTPLPPPETSSLTWARSNGMKRQESKPSHTQSFQGSASITSVEIPQTKAHHNTKPGLKASNGSKESWNVRPSHALHHVWGAVHQECLGRAGELTGRGTSKMLKEAWSRD